MKTIEFEGKTIYTVNDPRYAILSQKESDRYIAWYEMGLIDKGWNENQYCHIVMAHDKSKGITTGVFSITDQRCGVHYSTYLEEIAGNTLTISVHPDSSELEPEKKEINLEDKFK